MHDAELNIRISRFTVVGSKSHHNCKCGGFKLSFFAGGRHGIVLKVCAVCLLFLIQPMKVLSLKLPNNRLQLLCFELVM